MYPGMMHWLRMRRHGRGHCGQHAEAGPGGGHGDHHEGWQAGGWGHGHGGGDDFSGGAFGVRRPLRFLAFKLNLSEQQVGELAKILDELKTERAQAAVDGRRTSAAFADALASEAFSEAKAAEGANLRLQSAQRLKDAVVKALSRLHAVLTPEQRQKLATLIRTGALSI